MAVKVKYKGERRVFGDLTLNPGVEVTLSDAQVKQVNADAKFAAGFDFETAEKISEAPVVAPKPRPVSKVAP